MTETKQQVARPIHDARPCAWCSEPIRGESFTVTFPDKNQATFHVACLYQYRTAVVSPSGGWTGRGRQGKS